MTFCYFVTTIGLLRPTLLPGLARIRRGPRTVQFGVDPQRAVLVELADERAAAILDLLDGAHTERQILAGALRLGVRPADARALLGTLHAHGLLVAAHTLNPPGVAPHLRAEAAALALRQADPRLAGRWAYRGPLSAAAQERHRAGGSPTGRTPAAAGQERAGAGGTGRTLAAAGQERAGAGGTGRTAAAAAQQRPDSAGPMGRTLDAAAQERPGAGAVRPGRKPTSGGSVVENTVGLLTPAQVLRRRANARVAVAGRGRLAAPIAIALARSGVGHVRPDLSGTVRPEEVVLGLDPAAVGRPRSVVVAQAVVAAGGRPGRGKPHLVVQVGAEQPADLAAAALRRRGQAVLAVEIRDGAPVVGPFVEAGGSPCLGCLELHRSDRDPAWSEIAADLATKPPEEACDLVTIMTAAAFAAAEALAHIDGNEPRTIGGAVTVVSPGDLRRRHWPAHPRCSCVRT